MDDVDDIGNGFCCSECGKFCSLSLWNDNDICYYCREGKEYGLRFLNERGLKLEFNKWRKQQAARR